MIRLDKENQIDGNSEKNIVDFFLDVSCRNFFQSRYIQAEKKTKNQIARNAIKR